MQDTDKEGFKTAIRLLGAAFGRNVSSDAFLETQRAFWQGLKDVPLGAIQQAAKSLAKTGESMPRLVELRREAQALMVGSTSGCGGCQYGMTAGEWWSPVLSTRVEGMVFCSCNLGQRKADAAGSRVQTRRVTEYEQPDSP